MLFSSFVRQGDGLHFENNQGQVGKQHSVIKGYRGRSEWVTSYYKLVSPCSFGAKRAICASLAPYHWLTYWHDWGAVPPPEKPPLTESLPTGEISLLKSQLKDCQGDQTTRNHELLHIRAQVREYAAQLETKEVDNKRLQAETQTLREQVRAPPPPRGTAGSGSSRWAGTGGDELSKRGSSNHGRTGTIQCEI